MTRPTDPAPSADSVDVDDETETTLSAADRLSARAELLRQQAERVTGGVMATFPVRVWRRFLRRDGFLLAAGMSFQAMFASFAALYLAFSAVGLGFSGSPEAVTRLTNVLNAVMPGIIGPSGIATSEQVSEIASASGTALTVTGVIAVGVVIWTAIGFVTYARRAIRSIFGLPHDPRNYLLLKGRDFLAAMTFAAAILLSGALAILASETFHSLFELIGFGSGFLSHIVTRLTSAALSFVILAGALGLLMRFLAGAQLPWRHIAPGALAGGGALLILQFGTAVITRYVPSNPLLATFAVIVGLLLWFRVACIVMLVSAAWIAVKADDHDVELEPLTADQRARHEHAALVLAAQVRQRDAQQALDAAPWWRRVRARRELVRITDELDALTSDD